MTAKSTTTTVFAVILFSVTVALNFGLGRGKSQSATAQSEAPPQGDSVKTSLLDTNSSAVVLKSKDPEASSYVLRHSNEDPTMWMLDSIGDTALLSSCNKNPLLPARKVGDYCVASFQVSIKDAVCYLDNKHVNTLRCVWPNTKSERKEK